MTERYQHEKSRTQRQPRALTALAFAVLFAAAAWQPAQAAAPVYDVEVDIENTSGEKKTDWPVILTVYRLFGRNLPQGLINPKGHHVFGPDGKEVPCMVDRIPPYDQPGNDELAFIIPAMEPGRKLTWRITNTKKDSAKLIPFDVAGNANNLIKNGTFEKGSDKGAEGFSGGGVLDKQVKRAGKSSLLIASSRGVKVSCGPAIKLRKGANYYAGVWCKTENVARHGFSAGKGGCFEMKGFKKGHEGAFILPQCYTRDWNKSRFVTRHDTGYSDWGINAHYARATAESTTLRIRLDQKKQYTMDSAKGKWWLDDLVLMEQPEVTVRFDKLIKPALKDGCFLFTRPPSTPAGGAADKKGRWKEWVAKPFVHEGFTEMDRFGLKGQRAVYLFGLFHEKPLAKVSVQVAGGVMSGPGGAKIPLDVIEHCTGYRKTTDHPHLYEHTGPVDLPHADNTAYFAANFVIPRDAAPGIYKGTVKILFEEDKLHRKFPVKLRVLDLEMPIIRDIAVGVIHMQLGRVREETIRVYARSGWSSLTIFGSYLKYKKLPDKNAEVDLDHLSAQMDLLVKYGIQAGVAPHSDFELSPIWAGGHLYKRTGGDASGNNKEKWQAQAKRVYDLVETKPEWPRMIFMTWDEPIAGQPWNPRKEKTRWGWKGTHGGPPDPRMEWVKEVCPNALHTADIMFAVIPKMCDNYTMPAFDDTPDFTGPELYRYVKKRGCKYGFAGRLWDEASRYSPGMMMASSGAHYFHSYHLGRYMAVKDGKAVRLMNLVASGYGMDDLKIWRLLTDSIKKAKEGKDSAKIAIAQEAEAYLKKVFAVWNADHTHASPPVPYLGWAYSWGYDAFYDDWQEQMARYAAKLNGVKWIE